MGQFVLSDQRRNMSSVTEKSSKAGKKPAKSTAAKKVDAAHPPSSVMVQKAIEGLGEKKKGSSLASIKKYIGANYKVDLAKMNVFIRKALKSGIEKKSISASSEMSGRFKLNKVESKPKSSKPKSTKKATPKKSTKKPAKKATPKKAEKTKSVKKTAKKPVAKKAAIKPAAKKSAPKKK